MLSETIKNKRFLPLVGSQFISAINENFIRLVFLFFTTYKLTESNPVLTATAVFLYALVFCATSVFSGQLADKF